jgi:hypothetical protein
MQLAVKRPERPAYISPDSYREVQPIVLINK